MKSLSRNQITEQNYLCLGPVLCRFLFGSGSRRPLLIKIIQKQKKQTHTTKKKTTTTTHNTTASSKLAHRAFSALAKHLCIDSRTCAPSKQRASPVKSRVRPLLASANKSRALALTIARITIVTFDSVLISSNIRSKEASQKPISSSRISA